MKTLLFYLPNDMKSTNFLLEMIAKNKKEQNNIYKKKFKET